MTARLGPIGTLAAVAAAVILPGCDIATPLDRARKQAAAEQSAAPATARAAAGFAPQETDGTNTWHWATERSAELRIENRLGKGQTVMLYAVLARPPSRPAAVSITYPNGARERVSASVRGTTIRRRVPVGPTGATIRFAVSGKPYRPPGDPRPLYFQLLNPRVEGATDSRQVTERNGPGLTRLRGF